MWESDPSDLNPLSAISIQLKHSCAQLIQSITQKPIAQVSLLAALGLGGVSWFATTAIAPQSAQAYTATVEVALSRQSRESFPSFLRRAEAVARAATQRSFDRDILVSYAAVTVIGQNNGAIIPVLKLNVSRRAWRSRPDPQRWITYLPNTDSLLGFNKTGEPSEPQLGETPQPAAAPTPQPVPGSPRILELPGGNRRIIPGAEAPPATAPARNGQIPQIPGAPINRINPTSQPAAPPGQPAPP